MPPQLRRLNDIAFSGDGEPTTYRISTRSSPRAPAVKRRRGLDDVKMVLITNASMFHRPHVQRGLGDPRRATTARFGPSSKRAPTSTIKLVDRTPIPFRQILDNITAAAQVRPLVIQALFMRVAGEPPSRGGARRVLRSAERDHGRRRAVEAGAGLHGRPPAGGVVRGAAGGRRGRCDRGAGANSGRDFVRLDTTAARDTK